MENIVSVLELNNHDAAEEVNEYLEKGWKLLHVGPISGDISLDQQIYWTTYVVGATQDVYDAHINGKKTSSINQTIKELDI